MIRWGINSLNHGSSLAVFDNDILISNRFDRSDDLDPQCVESALDHGKPQHIFWYERPIIKKLRQLKAGQWRRAFDWSVMPHHYLKKQGFGDVPITYTPHHASHAAAGYYTCPFDDCTVVVLDAIGEFECASIWQGRDGFLEKLWSRSYPNSLGLFYSAFTDLVGLTPVLEEYKLQQLSEQGDPNRYYDDVKRYFNGVVGLRSNLHRGVLDWPHQMFDEDKPYIAAAVQKVFEEQISLVMFMAKKLSGSDRLVYMGGCAMNSLANRKIVEREFSKIWSLPQPGDPSSSIGAVLYHTKQPLRDFDLGIVKHIEIRV